MTRRSLVVLALAAASAAATGAALVACSETPTSVPVRTFERAQRMDVVCLRVYDPTTGAPVFPVPVPQENCVPTPIDVDGTFFVNQLFGLVTQSTRGELAVVNLTRGALVDLSSTTPGINFIPVGALPTDVAATPDGAMVFVASAAPNDAAIYAVDSRRILGDGSPVPDPKGSPTLASAPVCRLPQNPSRITVVPVVNPVAGQAPYDLIVTLPGDRLASAKIVRIDTAPFLRGAEVTLDPPLAAGATLTPGTPAACPILAATELVGAAAVPTQFTPGPAWNDGVPWVDGGIDLTCGTPARAASCGAPPCCTSTAPLGGSGDGGSAGTGTPDAGAADDASVACLPPASVAPDGGPEALPLAPLDDPRVVSIARDDQILYVADRSVPLIHVFDLSTPGAVKELPPLLATSEANPSRTVVVSEIAVSPPTRDFSRFLYAVDQDEGDLMVYDVTDPRSAVRTPLSRPNPEINPFQPPDRIAFAAPVAALTFARHDVPLTREHTLPITPSKSGALCNPNPNATEADPGVFYRPSSSDPTIAIGPVRLRGIFAFVTLSNGTVVTLDVDDWDAPCRRPALIDGSGQSDFQIAQPSAAGDPDPYHAPNAPDTTLEVFFPVSAPHRIRSANLLLADSDTGNHAPYLAGLPSLASAGIPLPVIGNGSDASPLMHPARFSRTTADDATTSQVGVLFGLEAPDVHVNQDWTTTYEGALPGYDGLAVDGILTTDDGYSSLTLTSGGARFCGHGVEDWDLGTARAKSVLAELAASGTPAPVDRLDRRTTDYIQLTENILDIGDAYWTLPDDPGQCWGDTPPGRARYTMCANAFGDAGDQAVSRDFPILEAYEDHLVLGRFFSQPNQSREVVYKDPSNADALKQMECCFHHQVKFKVRAASQWVTIGSVVGFLSHIKADATTGRCVTSCEPRESLLNGRAPALPSATHAPQRDSPLAMRAPAFSFFITNGAKDGADIVPDRDTIYGYSTRGQFQSLTINLASTTTAVSPQSMSYIESLGQVAIIDASSQGLILIDTGSVIIARAPYF